jgi:hypothetical protein
MTEVPRSGMPDMERIRVDDPGPGTGLSYSEQVESEPPQNCRKY